jgi:hypothetical protein
MSESYRYILFINEKEQKTIVFFKLLDNYYSIQGEITNYAPLIRPKITRGPLDKKRTNQQIELFTTVNYIFSATVESEDIKKFSKELRKISGFDAEKLQFVI